MFALFNIPTESTKIYQLSFLGGFPPKELQTQGKQTVQEMGIRHNDMLIVKFALSSDDEKAKDGNASRGGNEKDSGSNNVEVSTPVLVSSTDAGRQKRATAIAATANFRDVIAAQDDILNNINRPSPIKEKQISGGANIAGFGKSGKRTAGKSSSSASIKRPKVMKMEGPGYRLSDGQTVAGSSPLKKPTKVGSKHKGDQLIFNSEDDVANRLLSSLGGVGRGGKVSNYLRAAMRNAVEKSYEASRASVRVAAVNTGEFSFRKVDRVVDANHKSRNEGREMVSHDDEMLQTTLHTVSYSKGIEGRGFYEEEVEIIGLTVLKSVLESVYNTDSSDGYDGENVFEGSNDGRLRPVLSMSRR